MWSIVIEIATAAVAAFALAGLSTLVLWWIVKLAAGVACPLF